MSTLFHLGCLQQREKVIGDWHEEESSGENSICCNGPAGPKGLGQEGRESRRI